MTALPCRQCDGDADTDSGEAAYEGGKPHDFASLFENRFPHRSTPSALSRPTTMIRAVGSNAREGSTTKCTEPHTIGLRL